MSDPRGFMAGSNVRDIAKLAGLVVNFWNASNTYTKITAIITEIKVSQLDKTVWVLTYAYPVGNQQVVDSADCPEEMARSLKVGGTLLLLRDPETGEIAFADNADYIQALSLKLGLVGLVMMIGATVLLQMYPKP